MSESLMEMLERHEGFVSHAYQDSEGFWTIGVGRLIDKRRGGGITWSEARYLLQHDIRAVKEDLEEIFSQAELTNMGETRAKAVCDMRFQLGADGFREFERMIQALKGHDWTRAKQEVLDSLWAQQTPARAQEIAEMLLKESN